MRLADFEPLQHTGFRGIFPRTPRRKQSDEANEDDMASRLQLELGTSWDIHWSTGCLV